MKIFLLIAVTGLAVAGAIVVVGLLWLILSARRVAREHEAKAREEEKVIETADWIGTTGLDDATERALPRYLRRERGEVLSDAGALKAGDLCYVGAFQEEGGKTHYWRMPGGDDEASAYAYVVARPEGGCHMGWGDCAPPELAAAQSTSRN